MWNHRAGKAAPYMGFLGVGASLATLSLSYNHAFSSLSMQQHNQE